MTPIRVAIAQEAPIFLNLAASVAKAREIIAKAAAEDIQLLAFPETWLPGYPVWLDDSPRAGLWDEPGTRAVYRILAENSLSLDGPEVAQLREAAAENSITVVMGIHERRGNTLYNTILFLHEDGRQVTVHRKLMPTYTERLIWGRGDGSTLKAMNTPFGRLGGLICWEHWMPLARAALHARRETVHVAQWPMVKEMNLVASRHYAFEGRCFVLASGAVLTREQVLEGYRSVGGPAEGLELLAAIPETEGEYLQTGGSAIIAPDGRLLAGPLYDQPGFVRAELDPREITEGLLTLDSDGHYSRPDVFRLEINEQPQENVRWRS